MEGKIIRGIGGFYYVQTKTEGLIECKAKGLFRKQKIKPLVGDQVEIEMIEGEEVAGNIIKIGKRKNELTRPAVANVDQAVVIFAASFPKPNLNLLDRFLLMMKIHQIPSVICFNKTDDLNGAQAEALIKEYRHCGSRVCLTSAKDGTGIPEFSSCIRGKTSVLAGPSGVGKSSLMQKMFPEAKVEIGEISAKIKRGRHTTRHSELFYLGENTYVMDTPGFTALELPDIEKEELKEYYAEFEPYTDCRFQSCVHVNEPDCSVKDAVEAGKIPEERYQNYRLFYEEIRTRKKY